MIRVFREKDYDALSRRAASIIAAQIVMKPNCVLGLATGTSPIGTYKNLIKKYEEGELDFKNVKTVNLDEYVGLTGDNVQSYRYFMNDNLFDHVNIDKANTHVPHGYSDNLAAECTAYDLLIKEYGGIDLQLLGIGRNGHIGFNEPSDHFENSTNVVDLTQSTIDANSRLFDKIEDVPRQAITMGIGSIMHAGKVLLIASGKDKAKIIKEAFWGQITPNVPASVLQFHKDLTIVADEEALSEVDMKGEELIIE